MCPRARRQSHLPVLPQQRPRSTCMNRRQIEMNRRCMAFHRLRTRLLVMEAPQSRVSRRESRGGRQGTAYIQRNAPDPERSWKPWKISSGSFSLSFTRAFSHLEFGGCVMGEAYMRRFLCMIRATLSLLHRNGLLLSHLDAVTRVVETAASRTFVYDPSRSLTHTARYYSW